MKKKPDLDAFLGGGAADIADRTELAQQDAPTKQATGAKVHREQKVFRLPLDLINVLKREAYERSIANGGRVTETELVEQALIKFFKLK